MKNSWQKVKIRDICDVVTGGTPKTDKPEFWNGDINWMASGEVNKGRVSYVEKKITVAGMNNSNARMLPVKTIMIALAGQGKTRGKVAIIDIETTCNQSLAGLIIKDKSVVDPEYLFQTLESLYEELRGLSGGEGRSGLNLNLIKSFEILVPEFSVQQKIADILSSLDEAIQKTDQIIQKTERMKRGLIQNTMSFKSKEDVKHLALGDIGKVSMCKRIFKKETSNTGEVPFYKIGTFGKEPDSFISQELFNRYKSKFSFPKIGDVLLSASGTIGRKIKYDGEAAYFQDSNIIWLEHDESKVLNSFLFYLYDTISWSTEGSTIKRLYNNILLKEVIPVPSINEQKQIVEVLSSVDAKIATNQILKEKLILIKKGLMVDIFSQRIEVN